jgi:hypothetical protein
VILKSKVAVHYRTVDTPDESCHTCAHLVTHGQQPATCTLVQGTVDPQHVCDLYERQGSGVRTPTLEPAVDYFNSVGIPVERLYIDEATSEIVRMLGDVELDRWPFTPPSSPQAQARSRRERLLALFR